MDPTHRVLHVVYDLLRGGIGIYLRELLRRLKGGPFEFDLLVASDLQGEMDDEFRPLVGHIFRIPHAPRFWSFGPQMKRLLRTHGPYAIVHSHMYPGAYPLIWASHAGVPVRILHSHSHGPELTAQNALVRLLFEPLTRRWIHKYATHGVAVAQQVARDRFGSAWTTDDRWRIIHYGIDPAAFALRVERATVLQDLGLPPDATVIGYIARLHPQKNPFFMLEIARHLVDANSRVHVLLIGDGPLRPDVGARIASAALESNVHLLGTRRDMPRLWKALDAFVLPSLYEGLPLVLLEAQAAGVPGVVSDINPEEALIVPHLIQRKPLAAPPPAWAEEILAITRAPRTITPYDSLRIVQESDFNIDNSAHAMARLYAQALNLMPKSPDASMVAPQPS